MFFVIVIYTLFCCTLFSQRALKEKMVVWSTPELDIFRSLCDVCTALCFLQTSSASSLLNICTTVRSASPDHYMIAGSLQFHWSPLYQQHVCLCNQTSLFLER